MLSLEHAFIVSCERIADCREDLEGDLTELLAKFERHGFSRAEILVALSELAGEELVAMSGAPRIH
jgi:hypothetical protein